MFLEDTSIKVIWFMLTLHAVAGNLFQINNLQLQLESTFLVDSFFRVNKNWDEERTNRAGQWSLLVLARSLVRESIPSVRRTVSDANASLSGFIFCLMMDDGHWSPRFDRALQGRVVRKVDNVIHWINLYSVDRVVGFPNIYLQDSNLSRPAGCSKAG